MESRRSRSVENSPVDKLEVPHPNEIIGHRDISVERIDSLLGEIDELRKKTGVVGRADREKKIQELQIQRTKVKRLRETALANLFKLKLERDAYSKSFTAGTSGESYVLLRKMDEKIEAYNNALAGSPAWKDPRRGLRIAEVAPKQEEVVQEIKEDLRRSIEPSRDRTEGQQEKITSVTEGATQTQKTIEQESVESPTATPTPPTRPEVVSPQPARPRRPVVQPQVSSSPEVKMGASKFHEFGLEDADFDKFEEALLGILSPSEYYQLKNTFERLKNAEKYLKVREADARGNKRSLGRWLFDKAALAFGNAGDYANKSAGEVEHERIRVEEKINDADMRRDRLEAYRIDLAQKILELEKLQYTNPRAREAIQLAKSFDDRISGTLRFGSRSGGRPLFEERRVA